MSLNFKISFKLITKLVQIYKGVEYVKQYSLLAKCQVKQYDISYSSKQVTVMALMIINSCEFGSLPKLNISPDGI